MHCAQQMHLLRLRSAGLPRLCSSRSGRQHPMRGPWNVTTNGHGHGHHARNALVYSGEGAGTRSVLSAVESLQRDLDSLVKVRDADLSKDRPFHHDAIVNLDSIRCMSGLNADLAANADPPDYDAFTIGS